MVGFIVLVLFIGVLAGITFMVFKMLKETDPRNAGSSNYEAKANSNAKANKLADSEKMIQRQTAQDFLPFNTIENNVIDLGMHKYRAIIEVSSLNYGLRTGTEKETIELSFQRFLNSLNFPITIFIQTKTINDTKLLQEMDVELKSVVDEFPLLKEYANDYFYELGRLGERIGNNKQKKKYIIIPFDDAYLLKNIEAKEMKEYAVKELTTRVHSIIDGLSGVGLKATRLDSMGLYELIYSVTHKENYNDFESVFDGEYLELIVTNDESITSNLTQREILDWILYEAEVRIQNEINADNDLLSELIGSLEAMRGDYAGTDTFPSFDKNKGVNALNMASFADMEASKNSDSLVDNSRDIKKSDEAQVDISKNDQNEVSGANLEKDDSTDDVL